MNWADMILDTVGVANMDEVNLSDMIVSGVIFSKFTSLLKTAKYGGTHPIFNQK